VRRPISFEMTQDERAAGVTLLDVQAESLDRRHWWERECQATLPQG
jgi:hypothetical protein